MYKLVAAILLGNGVGGRMATAPHYNINNNNDSVKLFIKFLFHHLQHLDSLR